jgi:hypothetical protein
MPTIYIDADACPVKAEVVRVGERHGVEMIFVSNAWMRLLEGPLIKRRIVDAGPDAADDWIAENVIAGDVVITADIPLAARAVKAGASVIAPDGKRLTGANIGMAIAMRNLMTDLRAANTTQTYNAAFTPRDRSNFLQALEQVVSAARRRR